jgi:Mrp family chromosome partitioning ATPase
MNEGILVSTLLSSREAYSELSPHIDKNTFSDIGQEVYKSITDYYETDGEATKASKEIIQEALSKKHPKRTAIITEYLQGLPEATSLRNLLKLFTAFKRDRLGLEIIQAISGGIEDKAKTLMDEYLTLNIEEIKDESFCATPLTELELHFTGKNRVPLFPSKLSQLIGDGVPKQAQIVIFARPDVGKSVTAINIAVGAAETGYKVLYFGNEDPATKMMFRIVSRFTRTPEEVLRQDLEGWYAKALEAGYTNLTFVPSHPGTLAEIRKWVEKVKPDMVVIDQVRNLNVKPDSMTVNLEQASIGMRNLAKEFNFVSVLVTQAGESAVGKLVLTMEDVEWSNTGVAAQADLMIGVGQNQDFKQQGKVMLSFPKNKLSAPILPFYAKIDYPTQRLLT